MQSTRTTVIIALLFLIGACVSVEDIRLTEPVRTLTFNGSFKDMARCVDYRLRGKLSRDPFREEITIYNSVKVYANRGVSHYAITISQTDDNRGIVEWRKLPVGDMDEAMVNKFWGPVEDCAKEVSEKAAPGKSAALYR